MKAVAALRQQFGGPRREAGGHHRTGHRHAAVAVAVAGTDVRRPPLPDRLPLVRAGRAPARAGDHRARRPQRAGQDEPGRGDRLRRDARQPPGPDGRGARARGDAPGRWSGPRSSASWSPGSPRSTLVEIEVTPGKANRARVNGGSPTRARDVLGILRTVLFAPEDLSLVKGDPDGRRRFLDDLLVQLTPRVAGTVADYDRVLRQRSALLKSAAVARRGAGADLRTLDVWDAKLAQTGAQIIVARRGLVRALAPHVEKAYAQVSAGQGDAIVTYKASLDAVLEIDDDTGAASSSSRRSCSRRWAGCAARRSSAASASSGRTATTSSSRSAACRPRGTRATASRGRSRWRCGSRRTSC